MVSRADKLSAGVLLAGIVAAAIALAVTAAVTKAYSQPVSTFEVVITNLKTGTRHPWTKHTFTSAAACEAAVGNTDAILLAVADPDPAVVPPDPTGAEDLYHSVEAVVFYMLQNSGVLPSLRIACELKGTPA